jgi:hypothetical protein
LHRDRMLAIVGRERLWSHLHAGVPATADQVRIQHAGEKVEA